MYDVELLLTTERNISKSFWSINVTEKETSLNTENCTLRIYISIFRSNNRFVWLMQKIQRAVKARHTTVRSFLVECMATMFASRLQQSNLWRNSKCGQYRIVLEGEGLDQLRYISEFGQHFLCIGYFTVWI